METKTLKIEDVIFIHEVLVRDFAVNGDPIEPPGVKSMALLESAVGRQFTGIGNTLKYPGPLENAATLLYGICCDHPFHNGNKRTALVSLFSHLDKNNFVLSGVRQSTLYQLMLKVASHDLYNKKRSKKKSKAKIKKPSADREVKKIIEFLKKHAREIKRGERLLTFRALRKILKKFNIFLENPKKNQINVVRHESKKKGVFSKKDVQIKVNLGSISYSGDSREVKIGTIKQVRKMCGLSEKNGIDSSVFYDDEAIIDSFINKYRTVLRRLGKV